MLLKNAEIQIFRLDDTSFEPIGQINEYTSLIWPDKFNGFAQFELNAPVNDENKTLIKKGHVVWCGGDNAARIENIWVDKNENGQRVFKAKGRTLEMILTTRIVWGTYQCVDKKVSTAMYEIVNDNCVNPEIESRKIPFLECAEDESLGHTVTFQDTGSEVYDAIQMLATESELGFGVLFRPTEKKLIFKVLEGVDRTVMGLSGDSDNSHIVIFSTDLEDILSSSYYTNDQDTKTVAIVAGEGTGSERVNMVSGDNNSSGFLRRELYVDARDLQSEVIDEEGNSSTISPDEYNSMLDVRGKEKLAERQVIESFEAKIRVLGDVQYRYGVDYFKGDKVYVYDADLDILVAAVVSETSESFSDKYSLDIVFGFSYPTLLQKIKKQIL